jgi:hypothetical protein
MLFLPFPTPVLSGSGSMGIISDPVFSGTPLFKGGFNLNKTKQR